MEHTKYYISFITTPQPMQDHTIVILWFYKAEVVWFHLLLQGDCSALTKCQYDELAWTFAEYF